MVHGVESAKLAPMGMLRFNHMELTLPRGALDDDGRADIKAFYGEVFDFEALDVPIFDQLGLLLRTDDETSQFLLLMESDRPIDSPGYDHLGFLYDTREEVDDRLEAGPALAGQGRPGPHQGPTRTWSPGPRPSTPSTCATCCPSGSTSSASSTLSRPIPRGLTWPSTSP